MLLLRPCPSLACRDVSTPNSGLTLHKATSTRPSPLWDVGWPRCLSERVRSCPQKRKLRAYTAPPVISQEDKEKLLLKVWETYMITAVTVLSISPVLALSILTRGLTKILRIISILQLSNLKPREEAHIQVTESDLTPIPLASIVTIRKYQALHCEPFLPKTPLAVFAKALPPPPHSQMES